MLHWIVWQLLTIDEREALIRLRQATVGAHKVDLAIRREGRNEAWQADFLKSLIALVPEERRVWRGEQWGQR